MKNPEKAVKIVERWSKDHPQETYKIHFLKAFPNAEQDSGGPRSCRFNIYGRENKSTLNCQRGHTGCVACWDEPYPGKTEEK
jgi:hypothetical protein